MANIIIRPGTNEVRSHKYVAPRGSYTERCAPDAQQKAALLEKLRYKWGGYKDGWRVMQKLGDFGRLRADWLFYLALLYLLYMVRFR